MRALSLEVKGTKTILPDAEGVFDAIARIGYEFEHAVADLVDNSIDAGAANVLVRFLYDRDAVYSVAVIDDGQGMDSARMDDAMAFGGRTGRSNADLGKYGMGLKAASFSQCDVLTVVSRQRGRTAGRRWTAENVRKGWVCESIAAGGAERYLAANADRVKTSEHGTLVQWDCLHAMGNLIKPSVLIEARFRELSGHLGLVFHRFLESVGLRIGLDAVNPDDRTRGFPQNIKPLNPFPRQEAVSGYPKTYRLQASGAVELEFDTHIWRRNATEAGFRLGGGRLAKRQGFYIYRNQRLIQPGGWNGLRSDTEVHTSLARVGVDLPPALDSIFKPTVQKSSVTMPLNFLKSLRAARSGESTFNDYLLDAERVYRAADARRTSHGLVPTEGITKELTARFRRILGNTGEEAEICFEWTKLADDEFFRVDPDNKTLELNATYRRAVLFGSKGSSGDAPLVKTLLMLLCKDDMSRVNRVEKYEKRLRVYNRLLVEAVKSQL